MQVLCSHCHAVFEVDPEEQHKFCPNCKVEAGLEPIKTVTPNAMRYFGGALLAIAVAAVGASLVALVQ